jgi:D-alanyl-D-alanine carboxypeptidase
MFRIALFTVFFIFSASFGHVSVAHANAKYASIVVDAETGKVLRSRNANKKLYPASLTKIMTLYMAFDALSRGQLRLNERVRISSRAASMVPSKLNLPVGSSIKVEDAIYALVTKSANDVAVALGEKIAGSEWAFSKKMTAKARSLGMRSTQFKNASGLPNKGQISTARDMAILARAMIYNHPQYYHYFSTKNFKYRGANYKNHNKLLTTYEGMDGIKTGYIHASGFNLVASAVRDNRRLVAVVFGGRSSKTRNSHMSDIMDQGFVLARRLPPTRLASVRIPVPKSKPDITAIVLASMKSNAIATQKPKVANYSNDSNDKRIDEMLGQGDIDPTAARRLETGLMAIAAHSGRLAQINGVGQFGAREQMNAGLWAVQIGAYSSENISQQAIAVASKSLPRELRHLASATALPLTTGARTIYRARLQGFDEHSAQKACSYLRNCMVIAP